LKDVGVDLVEVADALNNRPDGIPHGMSLPRELGYRGLVIPKYMAWRGGGIRSRDIVIAPFGAAVILITVSTRDIFAFGILGFRGVARLLWSIFARSTPTVYLSPPRRRRRSRSPPWPPSRELAAGAAATAATAAAA
jgi:hypothetical protein